MMVGLVSDLPVSVMPYLPLVAFAFALLLALYLTPVLRRAAEKHGIVDRPDGRLKTQRAPVAYLGGLAIYVAFLFTLGALLPFDHQVLGLLLSASVIVLLGLIDDLGTLTPAVKLIGQLAGIAVLLKAGMKIEITAFEDHPAISSALTVLWLTTVTNAFNIIDVADGLAAGVAAVALAFLAATSWTAGDSIGTLFTMALLGAVLGFLPGNFAPARIYLGDTGSMFLGFLVAALSMRASFATHHDVALGAPVLLLAVPLFDVVFVSIHRLRRGRSPLRGSPDHFAVRLRRAGVSSRAIALGSYAAAALAGSAALLLPRVGATTALSIVSSAGLLGFAAAVLLSGVSPPAEDAPAPAPSPEDA